MINYFTLLNSEHQNILAFGETTLIQRICQLPFSYFCDKKLKDILLPTIISSCFENERNIEILNKEINLKIVINFLNEKIQLEPIKEEEEIEKLEEREEQLIAMLTSKTDTNMNNDNNNNNKDTFELKKQQIDLSTASSVKSAHDMVLGISDYVLLIHRFPRNLWEKCLDYFTNYLDK